MTPIQLKYILTCYMMDVLAAAGEDFIGEANNYSADERAFLEGCRDDARRKLDGTSANEP